MIDKFRDICDELLFSDWTTRTLFAIWGIGLLALVVVAVVITLIVALICWLGVWVLVVLLVVVFSFLFGMLAIAMGAH
jgi:hypothetical protein